MSFFSSWQRIRISRRPSASRPFQVELLEQRELMDAGLTALPVPNALLGTPLTSDPSKAALAQDEMAYVDATALSIDVSIAGSPQASTPSTALSALQKMMSVTTTALSIDASILSSPQTFDPSTAAPELQQMADVGLSGPPISASIVGSALASTYSSGANFDAFGRPHKCPPVSPPSPPPLSPPPLSPPPAGLGPNEPLLQSSNLQYVGAFRVPNYFDDTDEMSFGGTAIAFNPANNSLFLVGHNQSIAEISIPQSIVNSGNLDDLDTAQILQAWTSVLPQLQNSLPDAGDGGIDIGGLAVVNGQLIGTAYAYYSGAEEQTASHFVLDSLDLSSANVQGLYQVGNPIAARSEAGYMTAIPSEWQGVLGATYLTGQGDVPIISETSSGPAAFGFNPSDLGNGVAPSTPYLDYSIDNPLGPYNGAVSPIQNGTTTVKGAVFVPGTSTVLFFGTTGTNLTGYGLPEDYNDFVNGGKGPHSLNGEYAAQVWAYDAHDFAAVQQGTMQATQLRPYDVWNFTVPTGNFQVGGVAYDPASGRLYVSMTNAETGDDDRSLPLIEVFQVNPATPAATGPQIGTLAATPANMTPGPVSAGTDVTLTAGNVYALASGTNIAQVAFYLDTNNDGVMHSNDQLLGYGGPDGIDPTDHNSALTISTAGLAPGTYTIFVQAQDSNGQLSDPISTQLTIQ